jgi:hypothetical protein
LCSTCRRLVIDLSCVGIVLRRCMKYCHCICRTVDDGAFTL